MEAVSATSVFWALVALAWAIPLAAVAAGVTGFWRARIASRRPGGEPAGRLIIQITTRGGGEEANEVIEALRPLPTRARREIWVVVEEGAQAEVSLADRVVVVPATFECRATAKGRALEWARLTRLAEGIDGDDVRVLLLDDDSVPTARYLRLCEDSGADIAQGIVAPRRHYGRLLSHMDDLRPLHCLAVCSWAQGRGKPVHVHGEGLCLRASAEHAVTWDSAGSDLAEDLVFGQRASALRLSWAFLPAVIENTSAWTAEAFVTQRKRWAWGTLRALPHIPAAARLRVSSFYVITLGAFAASTVGTAVALIDGSGPAGPWSASLLAWLALFAYSGWLSSRGSILQALTAALLSWLTAVVNAVIVPIALLLGPPERFRTIAKLQPPRMSLPVHRVARHTRMLAATVPGLIALGLLGYSTVLTGTPASGNRWIPDGSNHLGSVRHEPGSRVATAQRPDLTRSMTVVAYGNDPYFEHKTNALLDRLSRLGVTHVSLTVPIFTGGVSDNRVRTDPELTPDDNRILAFATLAHRHGMTVGLSPLLDEASLETSGDWRGTLEPSDRRKWFASYRRLSSHFAALASRGRFQAYNVGTELVSLDADPRWRSVLSSVRNDFEGEITYAVWGPRVLDPEVPWLYRHVDLLGINSWYPVDLPSGATTAEINSALDVWRARIRRFAESVPEPIVITEAGAPSQLDAYSHPAFVTEGGVAEMGSQARTYRAICSLARQVDSRGVIWWATTLDPPEHPDEDVSFDPVGKPAGKVVEDCSFR